MVWHLAACMHATLSKQSNTAALCGGAARRVTLGARLPAMSASNFLCQCRDPELRTQRHASSVLPAAKTSVTDWKRIYPPTSHITHAGCVPAAAAGETRCHPPMDNVNAGLLPGVGLNRLGLAVVSVAPHADAQPAVGRLAKHGQGIAWHGQMEAACMHALLCIHEKARIVNKMQMHMPAPYLQRPHLWLDHLAGRQVCLRIQKIHTLGKRRPRLTCVAPCLLCLHPTAPSCKGSESRFVQCDFSTHAGYCNHSDDVFVTCS